MKKCLPASRLSTNKFLDATVSEHFLTNDHSANDITLIPLELIKSNRDSVRKAREAYLIERGKLVNLLVSIRKMKLDTIFIPFVCYPLFHSFFHFRISFISLLRRFLFPLTFTFFVFKFSHVIILSYCTLFFISNCNVLA